MSTLSQPAGKILVTSRLLCQLFSISRRTLHNWIKKGILPPPMRLGPKNHKLFWPSSEILALLKKSMPTKKHAGDTAKDAGQEPACSAYNDGIVRTVN